MKTVLVTGAEGFVGAACCRVLERAGYQVIGSTRKTRSALKPPDGYGYRLVLADLSTGTDWKYILDGVDVIIHLAARVHVMSETADSPLMEYRRTNVYGTSRLARLAAETGARRFIYVSSVKVNGEQSQKDPFTEADAPRPQDPYALSKLEAELALRNIGTDTGLEVVIIRPPLVYGPGVRGNFLKLLHLVDRSIPLPFGSISNSRSFIGLHNLCDLLVKCVSHSEAVGQTFLVSDGHDLSTPELIRCIAGSLHKKAFLIPCPVCLFKPIGSILKKKDQFRRLCGSLTVDSRKVCRTLNWTPPFPVNREIQETAEWFRRSFGHQE